MEESILVNGINVHYDAQGQGDVLLFVHGLGFTHDVWNGAIKATSKFYTTYAIDLPGFGRSDKPNIAYGPSFYADFINDFMDALDMDHAAVAGLSLGGQVAALFASRHGGRVSKLILSAPIGLTPLSRGLPGLPLLNSSLYYFLAKSRQLFKHFAESTVYDKSALTEELLDREWARMKDPSYMAALVKNARLLGMVDPSYAASLKSIKVPTVILWGSEDTVVPPADAERYHELIRDSEVHIIKKCGHIAPLERPVEFNQAFMTFLGEENIYYGID